MIVDALLPGDAVVGGEQADRGVAVLVAGGEQRLPVPAGLGVRAFRVSPEAPEGLHSGRVDVLIRPHRRGPRAPAVGRLGADGPRLSAQVAVVEARHAADRVEKQPAAHLDQLGIADVPTAGQVVRVHLAQQGERPPVVARLEDLDARPCRSDLALLTAAKREQDAAARGGSSPCSRCAIRPSRRCAGRWRSWQESRRNRSRLRSGRSPARPSTTAFACEVGSTTRRSGTEPRVIDARAPRGPGGTDPARTRRRRRCECAVRAAHPAPGVPGRDASAPSGYSA